MNYYAEAKTAVTAEIRTRARMWRTGQNATGNREFQ